MTIKDTYLRGALGSPALAAAKLAKDLTVGDPATHKAGYTIDNAILAARDVFPEVADSKIRDLNGWEE